MCDILILFTDKYKGHVQVIYTKMVIHYIHYILIMNKSKDNLGKLLKKYACFKDWSNLLFSNFHMFLQEFDATMNKKEAKTEIFALFPNAG